ncbi:MAG: hypothetical protein COU08_00330, partial [Candidatus Harrisonbacteria bacterium CG10_big_fil_rev_8_21_14_0_10_42_17]
DGSRSVPGASSHEVERGSGFRKCPLNGVQITEQKSTALNQRRSGRRFAPPTMFGLSSPGMPEE